MPSSALVRVGVASLLGACVAAPCSCSSHGAPSFSDDADASPEAPSADASATEAGTTLQFDQDVAFIAGPVTCTPGVYSGKFTCEYQLFNSNSDAGVDAGDGGLFAVSVSGDLQIALAQSEQGGESFLTVSSGGLSGVADGDYAFMAMMTGDLSCSTGQFTGEFVNGSWTGPPGLFGPATGTFTVSFAADYDSKTMSFVNGVFGGGCIGTWYATYAGAGDGGARD